LSVALLVLGPVIAATASTAKAVHAQKAVTCNAPPTVTVGIQGSPNSLLQNDLGYTNFQGPMERLCHTVVNLEYFSNVTTVFTALLGGTVQYITGSYSSLLAALQQGTATNVVALMADTQGGGTVLAAPIKDKANGIGIKTLSDYANVTWGIPSQGGAGVPYINEALKKDGVNPANVATVAVGSGGLAALESGRVGIDASSAITLEPGVLNGSLFFISTSYGLQAYQLLGLMPAAGLMTLNTTISQYRELTQQLTDVALKSLLFIDKNVFHPQTVYNATTPAYQAVTPYSTFAQAWPLTRASGIPLTGLITQKGLQRVANNFYNNGVIVGPVKVPKSSVNSSFLDEAYKSLGMPAPTSQVNSKILYLMGDKYTGLEER
jgi:ABC-type nitrate/sulfonate/bicarbonate transport system substrate-binding protein